MSNSSTITSTIQDVSIESCFKNHDEYMEQFFTAEEQKDLHERPEQSVAGILAVKRALILLCSTLHSEGTFTEKSFTITRNSNGAPEIVSFPDFSVDGRHYSKEIFSISISHNRTNAFGLVALQESGNVR